MSWGEAVWIKNQTKKQLQEMEQQKRLVGSTSSILKEFTEVPIANGIYDPPTIVKTTIGSFVPKYSGAVTINSKFDFRRDVSTPTSVSVYIYVNDTQISAYTYTVSSTQTQIFTEEVTIPVVAGETHNIEIGCGYKNFSAYATIKLGASLSESTLIE